MKENKNDSTAVLSRFGRDKRTRTVTATAERVERRPRSQRDAADAEQPSYGRKPARRASYNPNFTGDNRPAFGGESRSVRQPHAFGDRSASGGPDGFGGKSAFGGRERRFDDKPRFGYRDRDFNRDDRDFNRAERDSERRERDFNREYPAGGRAGADDRGRSGGMNSRGAKPSRGYEGRPASGGRKPMAKSAAKKGFGADGYGDRKSGGKSSFRKRDVKPVSYPKYDPEKQTGEMRLNRFIAQSGICSRREADDFIQAGLVSVNGKIVTEMGTKVGPGDEVKFNDSIVRGEKKVYLVLNKPKGYVTTLDDPHAGKTVMELVKDACTERIYPVGRLDKNSLGLLLFTNDGDLTKQLTHPSYRKKKIYQVSLDKPLTRADMDRLAEGITLEDGEIFADEISYVKENKQEVGIEIHSGRNRIVRRMFEFLGYTVTKLDRVYYAGLTKKKLARGRWRFLSDDEVNRLKSGQYE